MPKDIHILSRGATICLLAAMMAFSVFLSLYFFYGVTPAAGADNYLYNQFAHIVGTEGLKGFKSLGYGGVLSISYLLIFGIALFYKLFGYSILGSVLFDVVMLACTIPVIYLIGTELYDRKAGLIAAFLYSIFPLAITQASTAGDDVPMAFFASLAVLFIVLATKRKKGIFFFFSSFTGVVGLLIVSEEGIILLTLIAVMLFYMIKERGEAGYRHALFFFLGIALGVLVIMSLGSLQGSPMMFYTQASSSYNGCWTTGCSSPLTLFVFGSYMSTLLPYNMISNMQNVMAIDGKGNLAQFIAAYASNVLNPASNNTDASYLVGYYFYVCIIFAVFLLAAMEKRASIPMLWVFFSLFYLSFGTRSIVHYVLINIVYARFALLFLPGAMLVIAIGMSRLIDMVNKKGKKPMHIVYRYAAYALTVILLAGLFIQSVYLTEYVEYSWYNAVYPMLKIGAFIEALPQNVTIYRLVGTPIDYYADYSHNFSNPFSENCASFGKGAYVVILANSTLQAQCNWSVAFIPPAPPQWLSRYSLYNQVWDFPEYAVFRS